MSLADTVVQLEGLISSITKDMQKVHRGNKAAAQRVRVGTIYLEKIGKQFRKESVVAEKKPKKRKKSKR